MELGPPVYQNPAGADKRVWPSLACTNILSSVLDTGRTTSSKWVPRNKKKVIQIEQSSVHNMTEASAYLEISVTINILTKFVMIQTALKKTVTRGIQILASLGFIVILTENKFAYTHM